MATTHAPSLSLADVLSNGFCKGLDRNQLQSIVDIAETKHFEGGHTLIKMNDRSSDVLVVLSGGAKISSYHEIELAEVLPGTILGEIALVDEKPRSATVRTAGATTVAVINCEKLKLVLKTDLDAAAKVYRNLARALAVKLRVTTMRLDAAATSLEQ